MSDQFDVKFRATMYFTYGRRKRPEVTASSTFDAILRGERTSTTRFDAWRGSDKWAEAHPGDLAEFFPGKVMSGRSLVVRVRDVSRINLATCSDAELESWSRAEGWLPEEGRKLGRQYGPATWVKYELVSPKPEPEAPAPQLSLGI